MQNKTKINELPKVAAIGVCAFLLSACQTAENVGRDAEETPIGSVITGETTTANSYIKKVSERNKSLDRDTWRPQSSERF